jgi:hypothetical protein
MGANSTQALGVAVFLIAFVLISAGMAMGGSLALTVLGLASIAVSMGILRKAKPWEHKEG